MKAATRHGQRCRHVRGYRAGGRDGAQRLGRRPRGTRRGPPPRSRQPDRRRWGGRARRRRSRRAARRRRPCERSLTGEGRSRGQRQLSADTIDFKPHARSSAREIAGESVIVRAPRASRRYSRCSRNGAFVTDSIAAARSTCSTRSPRSCAGRASRWARDASRAGGVHRDARARRRCAGARGTQGRRVARSRVEPDSRPDSDRPGASFAGLNALGQTSFRKHAPHAGRFAVQIGRPWVMRS